jgi:hypothetical protein
VSVETYIGRRNTGNYHAVARDGVEVLVSQDLAEHARNITVDLKKFLFVRYLKAWVELDNGAVI